MSKEMHAKEYGRVHSRDRVKEQQSIQRKNRDDCLPVAPVCQHLCSVDEQIKSIQNK